MQGDHALFAVEQPAWRNLLVAFGPTRSIACPTPLRSVILANDPRIPSQAHVADGKVAVAASSTQVLVTWVTETILGVDDAVGGCRPALRLFALTIAVPSSGAMAWPITHPGNDHVQVASAATVWRTSRSEASAEPSSSRTPRRGDVIRAEVDPSSSARRAAGLLEKGSSAAGPGRVQSAYSWS